MRASSLRCSGEDYRIFLVEVSGGSCRDGSSTHGAPVCGRLTEASVSSVSSAAFRPLLEELCGILSSWVAPTV